MWFFKRKKRILIVEDDEVIRQITMRRMEKTNKFIPLEAANVESAIAIIHSDKPDYLLLDIVLNGESGFDLLEMMRLRKVPNIPTLITSNDQRIRNIEDSLGRGIIGYIVKPYNTKDIISKLN
ncbi:response regulator [Curvivirga sp.]|uniref:response regulator n=1 Tax=Curvivirga sp. TaxID=2856848 RepID=UPI003B5BCFAB